jgi:hypothetical protein
MTLPGNLQDIIIKIRELSGSGNTAQTTDQKIIKYINSYYLYDLPQDLRILKLKDTYTFNTVQGIDTYPFDFIGWSTLEAPAYSAKQQMAFYQDVAQFYGSSYNLQTSENFASGDGTQGPYSGTTTGSPVQRSINNNPMADTQLSSPSVFPAGYPPSFSQTNISRIQNILITANTATGTQNVTDDGAGNLIGDCVAGGTIDYQTGAIANLTFLQAIPGGNAVSIQYKNTTLGQPFSMLFYQNQLVLRPIPDKGYTIEIQGYRTPSQILMGTTNPNAPNLSGIPEDFEWWELIAFGVTQKLFQDRLDVEGVAMMQAFMDEKISQARTRTYAQLGKQRMPTIFADQSARLNNYGYGYAFGNLTNQ